MEEKRFLQILKAREEKSDHQKSLIDKYRASLIAYSLNIPGLEKDNPTYREIFHIGRREILLNIDKEKILYKELRYRFTGGELFILLEGDSRRIKEDMVKLEFEHKLGRIFDIDVLDRCGNKVSRQDLGYPRRKCLICNKDVFICRREYNHTYEDLIKEVYLGYLSYKLGE